MRPGIDPKVDYAFKKVFGSESNRDVLADLLNAVLRFGSGREVVEVEILNPFNDKEIADDKLSVVDIKASDATGRRFVVEMQMVARADHRQRVLYYATRLYAQQMVEGEAYGELRPAYLISFVNSRMIPNSAAFHTRFVLRDSDHNLTFTDDFALHMIELPKFLAALSESGDSLDNWCYFLMNANQLDSDELPERLNSPAIRKAMDTLRQISESERERELYESRLKRHLDDLSLAKHYAQRDAYYAQKEVEFAKTEAQQRQKEAEQRQKEAEQRQKEAEQRQKEAEQRQKEAEQRQKDEDLLQQREALASGYQLLADQFQALADRADRPETRAELLRQRDEQLTLLKGLRGEK